MINIINYIVVGQLDLLFLFLFYLYSFMDKPNSGY